MIWHILPVGDIKEHEEDSTCECGTTAELLPNGDVLIIHNAYDGREAIEVFNEIVKND